MIIAEMLVLFGLPAFFVFLTKKNSFFKTIGAVTLCYACGFLISVLPIPYDKGLSQTVASVLVAIAIPLILFGFDITEVRFLAKKTLIAFVLMVISVAAAASLAAFIGANAGISEAPALSGMATGLYIGGTPNMFAIGSALLKNVSLVSLANVADSIVGGIYILLVFSVVKKVYKRLLGGKDAGKEASAPAGELAAEYDYRSIPRDKKSLLRLAGVCLLAVLCLGVGVLIEILVNGNMDGSLYIMITVSLLGILFSFVKPVRRVKGSYQIGQYLILVFSLGLGMSIDWTQLISDLVPTFIFFASVQMGAIVLHFILCKIFRIDGGTALITSIAGVYGPPFIAPTANAYGDRGLIVPGVICGILGLVFGNLIGIALGGLLGVIL